MILALETTEKFGSVALLDGRQVLADVRLPQDRRSAQTLTVGMDAVLREHSIQPRDVQVVGVVTGPGSFTGLRVGVTAAKLFAYATGAQIVGLRTHEVVAQACWSAGDAPDYLSVGVDAQRGEVCVKVFVQAHCTQAGNGGPNAKAAELIPVADWWKQAEEYENIAFTGPALERCVSTQAAKTPRNVRLLHESLWMPKASVAGQLAAERFEKRQFDDMMSLVPVYSRLSAAEEKRKN